MIHMQPILIVKDSDKYYQTVVDAVLRCAVANKIHRENLAGTCFHYLRRQVGKQQELPAFELIDVNTPVRDGLEALVHIKQDPRLRVTPLVALSGSANSHDLNFYYPNGIDAHHVKPVNHTLHLLVLHKIFGYWLSSAMSTFKMASAS